MIITRTAGGMGNQMFQYAIGRALSLKYNVSLKIDNYVQQYLHTHQSPLLKIVFRKYDLDLFSISAEIATKSEIPLWLRFYALGGLGPYIDGVRRRLVQYRGRERLPSQVYDASILSLGPHAYIDGDWQSYKYFDDIRDVLQKDFIVKQPLPKHIEDLKKDIYSKNSVCVHVRRGDYVGNQYHEVVFKEYYDQALEILATKTTIEQVYVFSDDILWCKQNLIFAYPVVFVGEDYAGVRATGHFELMRSCKHFIIPNSSFSWWAAYLALNHDKIVLTPKHWFGDVTKDTSDLIPSEWIRL